MEQDMRFGLVWGQFAFIMNWAVEYTTFAVNFGQNIFSLNIVVSTPKLYIPSTLNIDLLLWHTQLIVCAVKSWFKSLVFPFTFQAYFLPHTLNCMCVSLFKLHI